MVQVSKSLQKAVRQIATKGEPIVLAGARVSGKSTLVESLALNEDVQNILAMREGGSVSQTNVIVTDFSEIPENCLIITAKLRPRTIADLDDNNALLGKVICLALKKNRTGNAEAYRRSLARCLEELSQEIFYNCYTDLCSSNY